MTRKNKKIRHGKTSKRGSGLMKWLFGKKSDKSPGSTYLDIEKNNEKYKATMKKYLSANPQLLQPYPYEEKKGRGIKTRKKKVTKKSRH